MIDSQLENGYKSSSGFRDAFSKIMGAPPAKIDKRHLMLKASWLDTKLGPMIAIADDTKLYLLEFTDRRGLEKEIEKLRMQLKAAIILGTSKAIKQLELELQHYFKGSLKKFQTPLQLLGSPFQKLVWQELSSIPYGETRSYAEQSKVIGKEKAYRAVANANGANQIAILIPCHRIINSNGNLGGYAGGIHRKQWLINHERQNKN